MPNSSSTMHFPWETELPRGDPPKGRRCIGKHFEFQTKDTRWGGKNIKQHTASLTRDTELGFETIVISDTVRNFLLSLGKILMLLQPSLSFT